MQKRRMSIRRFKMKISIEKKKKSEAENYAIEMYEAGHFTESVNSNGKSY